jgi:hypothetical protein
LVPEHSQEGQAVTKDEIECIVEKAVDKAVTRVLTSFGIDEKDHKEIRADFDHLRRWRKSVEQAGNYTVRAVMTAVVAAIGGAIWLGFKVLVGK